MSGVIGGVAENKNRLAAHQPQVLDASAYQPSSHAHPLVFRYDCQGSEDMHQR